MAPYLPDKPAVGHRPRSSGQYGDLQLLVQLQLHGFTIDAIEQPPSGTLIHAQFVPKNSRGVRVMSHPACSRNFRLSDSRPTAHHLAEVRRRSPLRAGCSAPADMSRRHFSWTTSCRARKWSSSGRRKLPGMAGTSFVIPVTIDNLAANGLLGDARAQVSWERSVGTPSARKDDIASHRSQHPARTNRGLPALREARNGSPAFARCVATANSRPDRAPKPWRRRARQAGIVSAPPRSSRTLRHRKQAAFSTPGYGEPTGSRRSKSAEISQEYLPDARVPPVGGGTSTSTQPRARCRVGVAPRFASFTTLRLGLRLRAPPKRAPRSTRRARASSCSSE